MSSFGQLGGMVLGAAAAPFTGGLSLLPAMAMGASLGGAMSPMWGGAGSPTGFSDALDIWNQTPRGSGSYSGGGTMPVFESTPYTPMSSTLPLSSKDLGGYTSPYSLGGF